nr:unnamed protein product [Callosobruchus chinensis]
MQSSDKT